MTADRLKLLSEYDNPLYHENLLGLNLVSLFEEMVARLPNEAAIINEEAQISYSALNERANQIARALLAQSKLPGKTVVAIAEISPEMALMTLAILKARLVVVGLSPEQPIKQLEEIIQNSDADILLCCHNTSRLSYQLAKNLGLNLINIDQIDNFESSNLGVAYDPSDNVGLIYTSGSTGKPKGLLFDHTSSLHGIGVHAVMGMDALMRLISIYHFSYGNGLLGPFKSWLLGGTYHPIDLPKVGIRRMIERIKRERITVYQSPPSLFRKIVRQINPGELPTIRWIHLGGEPVMARDIELFQEKFFPPCLIFNNYGSSEIGSMARNIMDHDTVLENEIVPLGHKTARMDLTIIDEDGNEVDPGQVGEMVVQSRYIKSSYWKDPQLTEERIKRVEGSDENIIHTGDLVYQMPDGRYVFAGRKDSLVKVRGKRVITAEVEAAVARIPGVEEIVIKAKTTPIGDAQLISYILSDGTESLTADLIRERLAERLPAHMIPGQFVFINEFPRTSSGKIDRQSLPDVSPSRPILSHERILANNPTEEKLTLIWERVLNLKHIGVTDNFFDLGGDSLLAVELFIEIENAFRQRLPISVLIDAGDIQAQASILDNFSEKDRWQPLVVFNEEGVHTPLFCFAGKGGNPIKFRQLAYSLGPDQPVYFLQSRGLSGWETPLSSVEEIADDFIQAILRVSPTGPYRLVGSSFGGKVAYEVACQLQKSGENVEFVMMLDTYGFGYPEYINPKSWFQLSFEKTITYLTKHWRVLSAGDAKDIKSYLKYYLDLMPLAITGLLTKLKKQREIKKRKSFLPKAYQDVEDANVIASKAYIPSAFSGLVILMSASDQPSGIISDPSLGWDKVAIGDFKVHIVDGQHGNLLLPPYVHQISEKLKLYLSDEPTQEEIVMEN